MKQKTNLAQISRTVSVMRKYARSKCVFTSFAPLLRAGFGILIVCLGLTAARAQVIPRVCYEAKPEILTRTLAGDEPVGRTLFTLNQAVPGGFYRVVVNPNGATQESFTYGSLSSGTKIALDVIGLGSQMFLNAHAAGETVLLTTDGEAVFGYNNPTDAAITLLRGIASHNSFFPGALVYLPNQPTVFQPGVYENTVRVKAISGINLNWSLDNKLATSNATPGQGCGTITYQGRLSDAGSAATGQFDLQFQAFDTLTDGIAQSELITLEDVQVTNGVFTVPLFFGSTLNNNYNLRFLQIGVRPGTSTGAYATLAPRQPITQVPFAVNAQTAQTAFDVRLQLTAGAPLSAECNETKEYGQMKADATNNKLWVCTATGWKSTVLQ